jgi:hypothetical protein
MVFIYVEKIVFVLFAKCPYFIGKENGPTKTSVTT